MHLLGYFLMGCGGTLWLVCGNMVISESRRRRHGSKSPLIFDVSQQHGPSDLKNLSPVEKRKIRWLFIASLALGFLGFFLTTIRSG